MYRYPLTVVLATSLLATSPVAQLDEAGTLVSPASVAQSSYGLSVDGDRLVGAGSTYAVTFDRGSVTYLPALGEDAPRPAPVTFRLTTIERDGAVVWQPAAPGARPEPRVRRDGDVAVLDRGRSVVERWATRRDGVELSYVFDRRPAGTGDLVVRLQLTTDLVSVPRPDGTTALTSGFGGVTVGAVTGIDAAGRRAPGSLRIDGNELELALPGAFVDSASYPLVLDPLIGTSSGVSTGSGRDGACDIAYDAAEDLYLVVWTRTFSVGTSAIYARRVQPNGSLVGGILVLTATNRFARHPRVANVWTHGYFLVTWQEAALFIGPYGIQCRTVAPADGALSSTVAVATTDNQTDPDVGGGPERAIVVWHDNRGYATGGMVLAMQIGVAPDGSPSLGFGASIATGSASSRVGPPAVAKAPAGNDYAVVWGDGGFGQGGVRVAIVRSIPPFPPAVVATDTLAPSGDHVDVDGDGTSFVAAWETREGGGADFLDVCCAAFTFTANDNSLQLNTPVAVSDVQRVSEMRPAVAWLGDKAFVAWSHTDPHTLGARVHLRGLASPQCTSCGPELVIGSPGRFDSTPQIATVRSGGGSSDEAMLVYTSMSLSGSNLLDGDVYVQRFEAFGGGPVVDLGGGCGPGGTNGTAGPAALGNASFGYRLNGGDPALTATVLNVAFPPVTPVPCGVCAFMPPAVSIAAPISNGSASSDLPIPCDAGLAGGHLETQWVSLVAPATPCALVPGIVMSNRLDATVDW